MRISRLTIIEGFTNRINRKASMMIMIIIYRRIMRNYKMILDSNVIQNMLIIMIIINRINIMIIIIIKIIITLTIIIIIILTKIIQITLKFLIQMALVVCLTVAQIFKLMIINTARELLWKRFSKKIFSKNKKLLNFLNGLNKNILNQT